MVSKHQVWHAAAGRFGESREALSAEELARTLNISTEEAEQAVFALIRDGLLEMDDGFVTDVIWRRKRGE